VIHPGHGGGRQEWPPEYYSEVGSGLVRRGWQVAVTGTGKEQGLVDRVCAGVEGGAVSLAGRLDLRQFAAVLAHAGLFVSVSTGPMHLAGAVGVPTVPLYGPTDLEIEATRFCPYGTLTLPVRSPVRCPCPSSRSCTEPVCMTGLRPDLVLQGVDRLQERLAPAGAS
jgi:ADP-heptose:LPS heptosyltransferase